jgi:heme-degrading monooxygenase HmoA
MIARTWHGIVPIKNAERFRNHLLKTGITEAVATSGNCGAYIYQQSQDDWEHFFMISYWKDFDSIAAFAGSDPDTAVCYPDDCAFGLISDPIVIHHEVNSVPTAFPLIRNKKSDQ